MERYLVALKSLKRYPQGLEIKLRENVKRVEVKKNDIIQHRGTYRDSLLFIESGLICGSFYIGRQKRVDWLKKEDQFIIALKRIWEKSAKTGIVMEALEDSVLWEFPATLLDQLVLEFPEFCMQFEAIMVKDMIRREEEGRVYQDESVDEWISYLREKSPDLLKRVPTEVLASLMDKPESMVKHGLESKISLIGYFKKHGSRRGRKER